jgi:hypothetical protein
MADSKLPPRDVAFDIIDKLGAEGKDFLDPEVRSALCLNLHSHLLLCIAGWITARIVRIKFASVL